MTKLSPQLQGALVALDPATVICWPRLAAPRYVKGGFNRALQAKRQPGSANKPLIYAAALEQGVTAASLWNDAAVSYPQGDGESWTPHNYDGKSHGSMTLRQALASSNNVIAVKLLDTIGIPAFTELAAKNGLALHGNNLSLALGTEEVTLHDLVLAYAPFATGGVRTEPRSILRIYETYRKSGLKTQPAAARPSHRPLPSYTSMAQGCMTSGQPRG